MTKKKILYAVQKTGNGHLARAEELLPILKKYVEVDILASGSQSELKLNHPIKYDLKGISLFYNTNGGLSFSKIFFKNNFFQFFKDLFSIPLKDYDLIINDFEPITAWSSKLLGRNIVALSHQASLWFEDIPKPQKINPFLKSILNYYAPVKRFYGFHFESYHPKIFTPVIRSKIRSLQTSIENFYLVYLPSFSDEKLLEILKNFPVEWHIFSKKTKISYQKFNCNFAPINEVNFLDKLASCKGVLCNAGFELPAEALFLNKKLLVIPINNQIEQYFNAKSLENLGVKSIKNLNKYEIDQWINEENKVEIHFPDQSDEIIRYILEKYT